MKRPRPWKRHLPKRTQKTQNPGSLGTSEDTGQPPCKDHGRTRGLTAEFCWTWGMMTSSSQASEQEGTFPNSREQRRPDTRADHAGQHPGKDGGGLPWGLCPRSLSVPCRGRRPSAATPPHGGLTSALQPPAPRDVSACWASCRAPLRPFNLRQDMCSSRPMHNGKNKRTEGPALNFVKPQFGEEGRALPRAGGTRTWTLLLAQLGEPRAGTPADVRTAVSVVPLPTQAEGKTTHVHQR